MKVLFYILTAMFLISSFGFSAWFIIPLLILIALIDLALWAGVQKRKDEHNAKVILLLENIVHQTGGIIDYRGSVKRK